MPDSRANKILIVSHEFDPHVDQMVVSLGRAGVDCVRWVTSSFPLKSKISLRIGKDGIDGQIETAIRHTDLRSIRSVWYRHPAPHQLPENLSPEERRFAEAEVRAALTGTYQSFDWFWVNHPDRNRVASSKILQLKLANYIGFQIPKTLVTNDPARVRAFYDECRGDIIYKPFNSGFFVGTENACYTSPISLRELDHLDLVSNTPGIFQESIEKNFELRITVIGHQVFATEIHSQVSQEARNDWRRADIEVLPHKIHKLPTEIERRCLKLVQEFGLSYGAIDMIVTPSGQYIFLENNPAGQFGWIEAKTGQPLTETLGRMLIAGRPL